MGVFEFPVKTRKVSLREEYPIHTVVVIFEDGKVIELDAENYKEREYNNIENLIDQWYYENEDVFYNDGYEEEDEEIKQALEDFYNKKIKIIYVFEN